MPIISYYAIQLYENGVFPKYMAVRGKLIMHNYIFIVHPCIDQC